MTGLHVVHRVENEGTSDELWTTYSFPIGIYSSGDTLQRARPAFHRAAEFHLEGGVAGLDVVEHIERPVYDDVHVRVAVDRSTLDRDAAAVLAASPTVGPQAGRNRAELDATMPPTVSGERVVVACVSRDPIGWVLGQTSEHDSIGIGTTGPASWIYLVRAEATLPAGAPEPERLGDAGAGTTVGELVTAAPRSPAAVLVGAA